MTLFERILASRGLVGDRLEAFLHPDYSRGHEPFLLPDMQAAVERLVTARERQEFITIYGDYDIDGLTATTVLVEAFASFGFERVETFIPNRFREGYGMTIDAVERIAATGATLIVTVDCGSLSEGPITRAKELGVDVIVTDHHNVAPVQPPAVAVINPKRLLQDYPEFYDKYLLRALVSPPLPSSLILEESALYPFLDLPGVGVAFKLVQALQTRLDGLPKGQEKWLLDLVALGTVCDVVTLVDENRTHVYWGLKVLAKTRRPGLLALMAVANVDPTALSTRSLGFALGPRMNAAGRLETASFAQELLLTRDNNVALELATKLDDMNTERRQLQDQIYKMALEQVANYEADPVLVLSHPDWNHGIIGIVAAKILEKFQKPTFVLQELGEESKGSARSYGDFSAADAIRSADDIITKGGGHKLAAGVTLPTDQIANFRTRVNQFFASSGLGHSDQIKLLLPQQDTEAHFAELSEQLVDDLQQLAPYGNGNREPVLVTSQAQVVAMRRMGTDGQHVKLTLAEGARMLDFVAFSAPDNYFANVGDTVRVWYTPEINEWRGNRQIQGKILHLEIV